MALPKRTCLACGESAAKRTLVRFVPAPDGGVVADVNAKLPGRGAYVCLDPACINTAVKKNLFARSFRRSVTPPTVDDIRAQLEKSTTAHLFALLRQGIGAGIVAEGTNNTHAALKAGNVRLALIATDASPNARDRLTPLAGHLGVSVMDMPPMRDVAAAIHRPVRGAWGIGDQGLADVISGLIDRLELVTTWEVHGE